METTSGRFQYFLSVIVNRLKLFEVISLRWPHRSVNIYFLSPFVQLFFTVYSFFKKFTLALVLFSPFYFIITIFPLVSLFHFNIFAFSLIVSLFLVKYVIRSFQRFTYLSIFYSVAKVSLSFLSFSDWHTKTKDRFQRNYSPMIVVVMEVKEKKRFLAFPGY